MDSLTSESLTDKEKSDLMQQIKEEVAVANTQEMLSKISEKCFKKCVIRPGTSLDNTEQKCVAMCMDRYIDAFHLVSKTYSARIHRERDNM